MTALTGINAITPTFGLEHAWYVTCKDESKGTGWSNYSLEAREIGISSMKTITTQDYSISKIKFIIRLNAMLSCSDHAIRVDGFPSEPIGSGYPFSMTMMPRSHVPLPHRPSWCITPLLFSPHS